MQWVFVAAAILSAVVGAIYLVGASLPRDHVAAVRARFAATPEAVWALIADASAAPVWREGLQSVEILPPVDGKPAWRETSKFGVISYALTESDPSRRMVARITDPSLPYGGQWEYDIVALEAGCELTITERGFVKPALFRFLSRYLFGYTATIESVQRSIGNRLGEAIATEIIQSGK